MIGYNVNLSVSDVHTEPDNFRYTICTIFSGVLLYKARTTTFLKKMIIKILHCHQIFPYVADLKVCALDVRSGEDKSWFLFLLANRLYQ